MPTAINLAEKLRAFSDHWSPRIVAEFNGHDVMVVKVKGTFVWHSHAETDDFFLVLKGSLVIQLRDGLVRLGPGDLYVVPRGAEHRPVAEEEVHLLLYRTSRHAKHRRPSDCGCEANDLGRACGAGSRPWRASRHSISAASRLGAIKR
jgi:mannose-6-phosphate isomerase-like protein (cupin superfamily)